MCRELFLYYASPVWIFLSNWSITTIILTSLLPVLPFSVVSTLCPIFIDLDWAIYQPWRKCSLKCRNKMTVALLRFYAQSERDMFINTCTCSFPDHVQVKFLCCGWHQCAVLTDHSVSNLFTMRALRRKWHFDEFILLSLSWNRCSQWRQ